MISGVQHTSFTVSDVKRSVSFYRDILGAEVVFDSVQAGAEFKGPLIDHLTGCPGTELHIIFLSIGDSLIELIEYTPMGKPLKDNQACDTGSAHICFKTDNIQELHDKLTEKGVRLHCPPQSL